MTDTLPKPLYTTDRGQAYVGEPPADELITLWNRLHSGDRPVEVNRQQRELVLMDKTVAYTPKRKPR